MRRVTVRIISELHQNVPSIEAAGRVPEQVLAGLIALLFEHS